MDIERNISGENATIKVGGRLDTMTAPELEETFGEVIPQVQALVLDLENLDYVSSAGLRILLKAQKALQPKKGLKLIHVNEGVMEVLDITGFSDILDIE